ncbi:fimbrillin family protein [Bacteroides sp.]
MTCKRLYHFLCLLPLLASCSQDPSSQDLVPLELRVRETVLSRATGRSLPEQAFSATVALTTTEDDYSGLSGSNEGVRDITVATDGTVTWQSPAYYPSDGSWLWLVAFSPVAVPANGQVVYALTGQEDLLYAPQLSGNRWNGERFSGNTDPASDRPLAFRHLLSRLQFSACKAEEKGIAVKIKKITVKEAQSSATLTLATGQVVFGGTAGLSLTLSGEGTEVTGKDPVALGNLIVPPLTGSASGYTLDVETSVGTYSDVPIQFPDASGGALLEAGMSHKVTLTLSDYTLGITSVQVSPWPTVQINDELELIQ